MTPNARMTVTAAVAVALTSTILVPLFINTLWFVVGAGAVITVAGTGALTRLRTLPVLVCLAGSLVGLLLYLNLVFEARHSLLLVLPTPGSLAKLAALVGTGISNSHQYAPQVPNLPGLLLLAAAGVGITAVLTDLIAVRLRSAAMAGLPLLVLFTVPVMINADRDQAVTGLVFFLAGVGYLAMLSTDGRERIRVWGRLVSLWRDGRARGTRLSGPDTRALAAAGRRVGLASIVLALCIPLLLPGLHPSKLFSSGPGRGGTGGGTGSGDGVPGISGIPAQTIEMLREHPEVVLTYTTNASQSLEQNDAQYLQQYVLEDLTSDEGWLEPTYASGASSIDAPYPAPQGLLDPAAAGVVTTTLHTTSDFPLPSKPPDFLPMFYPAVHVTTPGDWMVDPDLMVYSSGGSSILNRTYTVDSLVVNPTATELTEAPPPAVNVGPDLELPASYQQPALKKLAKSIVVGDNTEYAKAMALAAYLQDEGIYNVNAGGFSNAAGLLKFLTVTKTGVCVQFAWAMTVLARLVGLPARFVVGYTPGSAGKDGVYQVLNTDAHAWTEVYFQGYGWIRFEPTPAGQGEGGASDPDYMQSKQALGNYVGDPLLPSSDLTPTPTTSPKTGQVGIHRLPGIGGGSGTTSSPSGRPASTPWTAIALAVIAAIVLAGAVIAIVAPPAQRALSLAPGDAVRRRRPVSATSLVLVVVAAALVALALYRLLSRASGLDLGAGWATIGIAFGVTAAVMLVAPAALRAVRRRWRWMRATDDVSRAHAAWRDFHDDLVDYGVSCRASEPPRALAGRVTAVLPGHAGEAIRRIALAEERACYTARPSESGTLRRDAAAARRGLAASAPAELRWRARIFPVSLISAAADGAARIPDRLAGLMHRRGRVKPAG